MFISTDIFFGTSLCNFRLSEYSIGAMLNTSLGLCLRMPTSIPGLRNPILFIHPVDEKRKVVKICLNLPGRGISVHDPVTEIASLNFK